MCVECCGQLALQPAQRGESVSSPTCTAPSTSPEALLSHRVCHDSIKQSSARSAFTHLVILIQPRVPGSARVQYCFHIFESSDWPTFARSFSAWRQGRRFHCQCQWHCLYLVTVWERDACASQGCSCCCYSHAYSQMHLRAFSKAAEAPPLLLTVISVERWLYAAPLHLFFSAVTSP